MVYSTRRFVLCLTLCHFVLVFFSPFSIAITSLGEERANLSAFRTFVRFVLVWICRFPLPLGVWEGLRFMIVALPGHFSHLFWQHSKPVSCKMHAFLQNAISFELLYSDYPIFICTKNSAVYLSDCRVTFFFFCKTHRNRETRQSLRQREIHL